MDEILLYGHLIHASFSQIIVIHNNLIFGRNQMRNIIQTLYAYLSDVLGLRNKGVGALVPTSETTDTRKYIEILEKYLRP